MKPSALDESGARAVYACATITGEFCMDIQQSRGERARTAASKLAGRNVITSLAESMLTRRADRRDGRFRSERVRVDDGPASSFS